MESLSFDEFSNRINYDKEASKEQQNELLHWLEMIGVYKYNKYYKVLGKESKIITFEDLKNCAIYDFNLSRILFAMLKHCENYLRATVTSDIDDFLFNRNNCSRIIKDKFVNLGRNFKVYWSGTLEYESSFYKYLDASGFSTIIDYYLTLPKNRIIFDPNELRGNLYLVKSLRNSVYHHNCLLDDNFEKNELKLKIMTLFRYVPSPNTRSKYIDYIDEEIKLVGNKYRYPIRFSPEEKDEIMNYRGCNNEYKD